MNLQPGTPIERYVVQEIIGYGGMATVYRVKHAVLGTQHALKLLQSKSTKLQEELIREGRLQARLDPDFVVPVHDVLSVNGSPALLMPLVQGCSLRDILNFYRPTQTESAAVIAAVARGIATAHENGIVHRDLKPGNVLIDIHRGRIRIRVADFGLGVTTDVAHGSRGFVGTPAYAGPEQLAGQPINQAADLWSIGVMLVECSLGRLPFTGLSPEEFATAIRDTEPRLEEMPKALRRLATSLLHREAHERAPSAADLADELERRVPKETLDQAGSFAEAVRRYRTSKTIAPESLAQLENTTFDSNRSRPTFAEPDHATERPRHNLPLNKDAFVGRSAELQAIHQHLSDGVRLLTLRGEGGSGKTRLAVEYAKGHLDEWGGGVWFCDLTEAHSVEGIAIAIGRALDVPLDKESPIDQIGHAIAGRGHVLLIVDNVEQVADEARQLLSAYLERAPECSFIATSRVVLNASRERVWAIPPMTPTSARELFVLRARNAKAVFAPTDDDLLVIDELVSRLDNLPLAIELAAARIRMMSPEKMLKRIGERFRLLTSKDSTKDRHRTLKAALDWSWELLADWEKAALAQCSVFEGGFDLEAAEAVLDLDAFGDAPWPIDAVQSLVDKSLARAQSDDRFTLLMSIQEYAHHRLEEMGDVQKTEARHGMYYADFGTEQALTALDRHGGVELRRVLSRELDNVIVAWERARSRGDATVAVNTVAAALAIFQLEGPNWAAVETAEECLLMDGLEPVQRARIHLAAGEAHTSDGNFGRAKYHYETALQTFVANDDAVREAIARNDMATLCKFVGDAEGSAHQFRLVQDILEELKAHPSEGVLHLNHARFLQDRGKLSEAEHLTMRAIASFREQGNRRMEALAMMQIGLLRGEQGRLKRGIQYLEQGMAMFHEVGDRTGESRCLANIGFHRREQGQLSLAREHYLRGLRIDREVGARKGEAITMFNLGDIAYSANALEEAEADLLEASAIGRESFLPLIGISAGTLAKVYARTQRVEDALHTLAEGEPYVRKSGWVVETAKFLGKKATALALCGRVDEAHEALEESLSLHEKIGGTVSGVLREISEAKTAMGTFR